MGLPQENTKFYFNIIISKNFRSKKLGGYAILTSLKYLKLNYYNIKEIYAIVKCENLNFIIIYFPNTLNLFQRDLKIIIYVIFISIIWIIFSLV